MSLSDYEVHEFHIEFFRDGKLLDGFNFETPQKYRYTKEHPYVGKGIGRNVKKDKRYTE